MSATPAGTQSINRTLDILECFLDESQRGINEIARLVELSPSTTHRLVRALAVRGYLEQDPRTERYHLGRSAAVLSSVVQRDLGLDRVQGELEQLGQQTGESINMGLLDGDEVVVALRVSSPQPLRFDQPVGTRLPLHRTAMGKALLAARMAAGEDVVSSLALDGATPSTITSKPALEAELAATVQRGFSLDEEESTIGVSCVGAAIPNLRGHPTAAIAIQAPTVRMNPERAAELSELVVKVADDVGRIYLG